MPDRPNIVFVFADQLRSQDLPCYGGDQLCTPNMDRLAAEGIRFTNAISTHPVCGPYRGMLMSGNFPFRNGMVQTDHFLRNPDPYFAEVCRAAGYETAYIGKWHLDGYDRSGYIPPERRLGFEYWKALECTHSYFSSKYYQHDEKEPRVWPEYDAISQTRDACEYIRTQHRSPFCLFLSWGPPHGPYNAPPDFMARFRPEDIRLRANVDDFATGERLWAQAETVLPEKYKHMREARVKVWRDRQNRGILRQYQGYYAAIEALDDCLGMLIAALEDAGKLEKSLLVFTSDHGDNLGSHRQLAKQLPFEESIAIPLLIRYPDRIPSGSESDVLFRPVDIMPTLLDLAGVPCHDVDGRAIPIATSQPAGYGPDAVLLQKSISLSTNWITNGNGPWAGVRTMRYTYARLAHSKRPWLLYDNRKDPYQLANRVNDPDFADIREFLDQRTDRLLAEAGEPGDPAIYARTLQEEREERSMPDRWAELSPELSPDPA